MIDFETDSDGGAIEMIATCPGRANVSVRSLPLRCAVYLMNFPSTLTRMPAGSMPFAIEKPAGRASVTERMNKVARAPAPGIRPIAASTAA